MDEILHEFIFDSRDHLGEAGSQLLDLEREPSSLGALNSLMGVLHTIKGNSGFVGLQNLYSLLHQAESLLQTVREIQPLHCPAQIIDQLFQVLDTAEAILARLEKGDDDRVDWFDSLNQALREAEVRLEQSRVPEPEEGAPEADAAAESPALPPAADAPRELPPKEAPVLKEDLRGQMKRIKLKNGQLAAEGMNFLTLVEAMFSAGLAGILIDLRQVDQFTNVELGLLLDLHKKEGSKIALLMDLDRQKSFYRVFQVLHLDRVVQFFADEKSALAALAAGRAQ